MEQEQPEALIILTSNNLIKNATDENLLHFLLRFMFLCVSIIEIFSSLYY